jgi:HEAT repeats
MPQADIQLLFQRTLEGDYEDEKPWDAVRELRHLGTREVFDVARQWCGSTDPLRRARGLDVIAQLGKTVEHRSNSFPDESYFVVSTLIANEQELRPLSSAIAALGHLDDPRGVPLIAQFQSHPDSEIRFNVTCALGSFPNEPLSVEALIRLIDDEDEDVRDWATFGLGVLGDQDSTEIREALVGALNDSNEDVREEALVALAKRHDLRALSPLLRALEGDCISMCVIEAAYTLLGFEAERKDWATSDYASALRQRFPDAS